MAAIGEYVEDAQPREEDPVVEHVEDAQPRREEPVVEAALEGEAALECGICSDVLKDGAPVHGLPCAHAFHLECLDAYGKARGMNFERLPCPTCKKIPIELAQQGIRQRADMRIMQARANRIAGRHVHIPEAVVNQLVIGEADPVPVGDPVEMDEPVAEPVPFDDPDPVVDPVLLDEPVADPVLLDEPVADPVVAMVPEADPPVDAAAPVEPAADPPVEPPLGNDTDTEKEDSDDEALLGLQLPPAGDGAAPAKGPAKGKATAAPTAAPTAGPTAAPSEHVDTDSEAYGPYERDYEDYEYDVDENEDGAYHGPLVAYIRLPRRAG